VASHEEAAAALAEGQDTDERLDTTTMLLSPVRAETVGAGAR